MGRRTPSGEDDAVGRLGDVLVDQGVLFVEHHLHAVHRPKLHLPLRQLEELLRAALREGLDVGVVVWWWLVRWVDSAIGCIRLD